MTGSINRDQIRFVLDILGAVSTDALFGRFERLCLDNGGRWDVPKNASAYRPYHYETTLFGVSVAANNPADLPINWMRAARRILEEQAPA